MYASSISPRLRSFTFQMDFLVLTLPVWSAVAKATDGLFRPYQPNGWLAGSRSHHFQLYFPGRHVMPQSNDAPIRALHMWSAWAGS